jgi:nucleotide-binding universal stress UspA family protein
VVAGWSGSKGSDRALDVAAGFAERHAVPLHVVLGWDFLDQPMEFDPHLTAEQVEALLADAVARVQAAHPAVAITSQALLGWAPTVVREAAAQADLLVVGRSPRASGHFGEWSADVLIRRVPCPIVFVP